MTDQEIIQGLISRDNRVTKEFFFNKCRPLFCDIIRKVFTYEVDYDEFVNELYIYLMENDAVRLKQYEGRSSLYQWLKTVALRFALKLRQKGKMIDTTPSKSLYNQEVSSGDESDKQAKMDVDALLSEIDNERQVYVLRRHIIDGIDEPTLADELGIKVSNLYNIKKRAMTALMKVALTDIQQYGKKSEQYL